MGSELLSKKLGQGPLIIGLTILLATYFYVLQPRTLIDGGKGSDGSYYYKMAETLDFRSVKIATIKIRILLPTIVHGISRVLDANLLSIFFGVNFLFAIAYSLLSYMMLTTIMPQSLVATRLIGWLLLNACFMSPMKWAFFYPTITDISAGFWLLVLIILTARLASGSSWSTWHNVGLGLTVLFGTLTRENFIIYPTIILFGMAMRWEGGYLFLDFRRARRCLAPLFFAVVAILLAGLIIKAATGQSIIGGKLGILSSRYSTLGLTQALMGLLNIYGVMLLLSFISPAPIAAELPHMFVPLVTTTIVTIILFLGAGSDTERHLSLLLPLVVALLAPKIDDIARNRRYTLLASIGFFFLLSQRFFWPIATERLMPGGDEYFLIFLTIIGKAPYLSTWARFTTRHIREAVIATYGLFYILVFVVLKLRFLTASSGLSRTNGD